MNSESMSDDALRAGLGAEVLAALDEGEWRVHWDTGTSKRYFSNTVTKETVWNLKKHLKQVRRDGDCEAGTCAKGKDVQTSAPCMETKDATNLEKAQCVSTPLSVEDNTKSRAPLLPVLTAEQAHAMFAENMREMQRLRQLIAEQAPRGKSRRMVEDVSGRLHGKRFDDVQQAVRRVLLRHWELWAGHPPLDSGVSRSSVLGSTNRVAAQIDSLALVCFDDSRSEPFPMQHESMPLYCVHRVISAAHNSIQFSPVSSDGEGPAAREVHEVHVVLLVDPSTGFLYVSQSDCEDRITAVMCFPCIRTTHLGLPAPQWLHFTPKLDDPAVAEQFYAAQAHCEYVWKGSSGDGEEVCRCSVRCSVLKQHDTRTSQLERELFLKMELLAGEENRIASPQYQQQEEEVERDRLSQYSIRTADAHPHRQPIASHELLCALRSKAVESVESYRHRRGGAHSIKPSRVLDQILQDAFVRGGEL